jgi:two-component system, NtrC family, sensor kinase
MNWFRRLPLSRKILLGILPLFLIFISVSVIVQNRFQEREMMDQARSSAHVYAEILKESLVSMMVSNLEVDSTFLDRLNALQQFDTIHVLVNQLRLRQELLTPQRQERLETKYRSLNPHDDIEREVLASGRARFTLEGDHFRGVIPFTATSVCQKCHAVPVGYTLGAADLHISFERITEVAAGNWKRSFVIFLIFSGIVMTSGTFLFTRFVSRPVDRLVHGTKEIGRGNLEYSFQEKHLPDDGRSRDELAFLTRMFDAMRMSLRDKMGQIDQANADLSERNREIGDALQKLKEVQEELIRSERLAVTGRMTAQLSHEINNPIHNIQSLLESSLRKLEGNAPVRDLIGVALEEVSRMAKLTRQMLDFYRGSVVDAPHEAVDIGALLEEVRRLYEQQLAEQQITMHVRHSDDSMVINGSRDKLKQVLINLIHNARDAMPQGGELAITCARTRSGISIALRDSGVGIPPENQARIFDAFFTTKKEMSGVGLGLAVCYGIMKHHNGSIEVQSVVGEGTTFTLHLPT